MIKNIIFAGGGLKCWAYIGTLRALQEYNIKGVEQIIGVSAGSLFGLFYVLGIDWAFVLDFFMNVDFKELIDIDIDTFLINQSLLEGKRFTQVIKEIIAHYVDPDITFKDLRTHSKIKFTLNALNISDSKLEYFNYQLTPDVKVVDAIRASCNLPLFFPPYKINKKWYYDGGLCNNCPVDLVDEIDSIAFDISHTENSTQMKLMDLLSCLANKLNDFYYNNKAENIYKITDNLFNDQVFNLKQTRDDIFNIYMNGYTNSKNILFKNHIALAWH
jgi:NTE family protein